MAVDTFLKITAGGSVIQGESKSKLHKNEIDVLSWHWGATFEPGPTGGARERKVEAFTFTHRIDKASPLLLNALAQAQPVNSAVLTVEKRLDKPLDYLTYTMTNALISAIHHSGEGSQVPVEEVSIFFNTLHMSYKPFKPDGTLGSELTGDISWTQG